MRKLFPLILCLVLLLGAASCGQTANDEPFSAAFTIRPEESLTEVFFDAYYADETRVVHSDALDYAALRTLFVGGLLGSDDGRAARWNTSLQYALEGAFTPQDAQVASELAMELVRVNGFPGIRETTSANANVRIRFEDASMPQFFPHTDEEGHIRSVQITIPSSYLPAQRSAALRQYMMRGCGFFHTAETSLDSVLAEKPASDLTEADVILLNILYDCVEAGSDRQTCIEAFERYFETE